MNELGDDSEAFHEEIGRFMLEKITKTSFIGKYRLAYQSGFVKRPSCKCVEEFQPIWAAEQEKFIFFYVRVVLYNLSH